MKKLVNKQNYIYAIIATLFVVFLIVYRNSSPEEILLYIGIITGIWINPYGGGKDA